jgi:Protein of unknown function (DUF3108)
VHRGCQFVLLLGRSRHLTLGHAAWLLAVVFVHGLAWWRWEANWPPLAPSVDRLHVALVRPMAVRAELPARQQPSPKPKPTPRRLSSQPAVVKPSVQALPTESLSEEVLALPVLAEHLPEVASQPPMDELADAQADGVGPEWPLSTRLVYALHGQYQGPVHGDAEVQWLREGPRYQMHLQVRVGPKSMPFISRTLGSQGVLTPQGIRPQRYVETTRMFLGSKRVVSLELGAQSLTLANGQTLPTPAGVQDSASQFVHLTWLLQTGRVQPVAGHVIDLPLALPRSLALWRYEVVGNEPVNTPLGELTAWHLRPLSANLSANVSGALLAEVWLAPQLQWLPVRIRILQGADVWVELNLSEVPLQEAENASSKPATALPP